MRLFRFAIDSDSNTKSDQQVVSMEEHEKMETGQENNADPIRMDDSRKEALVHDLISIVKNAMVKVNNRDQMWCDILAKTEKDIRKSVDTLVK